MENALPSDFKEFLSLLNAHQVEYLLVGDYAVTYHGYPRATNDIDFWVAANPVNADRLTTVLREFGFDLPDLKPDWFLEDNRIVRLGQPPMRIEITTSLSGVRFEECYLRCVSTVLDGVPANVIGLADLRANKRAAGRLKDLADLENLP
jgi:hypothetical protein